MGATFGRLVVLEYVGEIAGRQAGYRCRCECGREVVTAASRLRRGVTTSCGCYRAERILAARAKKRILPDSPQDPVVAVWRSIVFRCINPKSPAYPRYGGRGVTVCERWRRSVHAFLEDMGPRPTPKHTVERVDNDGNYEPGNCRWATRKEQGRNKPGQNVRLTCGGRTKLLTEWAEETGMSVQTLWARLKRGWDHEKALTTPVRKGNYRRSDTG